MPDPQKNYSLILHWSYKALSSCLYYTVGPGRAVDQSNKKKKNECKDCSKEIDIKYIRNNIFTKNLCNKHIFKLFMKESLTELLVIMILDQC